MSTNTPRRNARGEASLRAILAATSTLVTKRGYANTTIAGITRKAGRPASSIYWYFETKDDLITAALEDAYRRSHRSPGRWTVFDSAAPLRPQLLEHFADDFLASAIEQPVRIGIMLALEGGAAGSAVHEPFRRRRNSTARRLIGWWQEAVRARAVPAQRRDRIVAAMVQLTLSFLDGHYVSDTTVDADTAQLHTLVVATSLEAAFDRLVALDPSANSEGALTRTGEPSAPVHHVLSELDARQEQEDRLLSVTRDLVAAKGYEGATIGEICAASGLQRSSVYRRHKHKDALIAAAVAGPFVALFEPLHDVARASELAGTAALGDAIARALRRARLEPDTVKAGLLLKVQRTDPPTTAGLHIDSGTQQFEVDLRGWFAEVATQSGLTLDPGGSGALAWALGRLLDGILLAPVLNVLCAEDGNETSLWANESGLGDTVLADVIAGMFGSAVQQLAG